MMITRQGFPPSQVCRAPILASVRSKLYFAAALERPPLPKEGKGWPRHPWYKKYVGLKNLIPFLVFAPLFAPDRYVTHTLEQVTQQIGLTQTAPRATISRSQALQSGKWYPYSESPWLTSREIAKSQAEEISHAKTAELGKWALERSLVALMTGICIVALDRKLHQKLNAPNNTEFGTDIKEWASYHELGHLLSWLSVGDPRPLRGVTIKEDVTLDGFVTTSPAMVYQEPPRTFKDESDLLKFFAVLDGGESMERLVYGWSSAMGGSSDRYHKWILLTSELNRRVNKEDRNTLAQYIFNREPYALAVLKQFDFETVQALAKRLSHDETWDAAKIEDIIQEFKLRERIQAQAQAGSENP